MPLSMMDTGPCVKVASSFAWKPASFEFPNKWYPFLESGRSIKLPKSLPYLLLCSCLPRFVFGFQSCELTSSFYSQTTGG
uniref:Putative ovule protein n=1 Tax=Solanum chacoense TaxID=4108 RepID=A0A0V0HZT0_SOLCH